MVIDDGWEKVPRFGGESASPGTIRPCAYGLVRDHAGHVAIVQAPDGVFLPGGGIEAGETPESALVREALEECGWTVDVGRLVLRAVQHTTTYIKPSSFYEIAVLSGSGEGHEPGHMAMWLPPRVAVSMLMHQSHGWAVSEWVRSWSDSPAGERPARSIVGFHQDEEGHWVADLECGHSQHVRHDPPWQARPWVLTAEGRASKLGVTLACARCPPELRGD